MLQEQMCKSLQWFASPTLLTQLLIQEAHGSYHKAIILNTFSSKSFRPAPYPNLSATLPSHGLGPIRGVKYDMYLKGISQSRLNTVVNKYHLVSWDTRIVVGSRWGSSVRASEQGTQAQWQVKAEYYTRSQVYHTRDVNKYDKLAVWLVSTLVLLLSPPHPLNEGAGAGPGAVAFPSTHTPASSGFKGTPLASPQPPYSAKAHPLELSIYMAPLGRVLMGTLISITGYLHARRVNEASDRPLTDYEYSGSEGKHPASEHLQQTH
ncbi:hypothetical protein EDB85DRAFT_1895700 [Lactarius pseudohatsudake]|nr:hypothetical protein EDB85DRAFT_1895700 [Lactarius pseudohatsudake]